MTPRALDRQYGLSRSAKILGLALLFLAAAAGSRAAVTPPTGSAATALARDSARCRTQADLNACYDAIRWSPGDPGLLVALGDALVRSRRPADAIRYYRRAAVLAPTLEGVAAKIAAAEAKASPRRAPVERGAANAKHYSNTAPEAQTH
jgi:hypothetical protein